MVGRGEDCIGASLRIVGYGYWDNAGGGRGRCVRWAESGVGEGVGEASLAGQGAEEVVKVLKSLVHEAHLGVLLGGLLAVLVPYISGRGLLFDRIPWCLMFLARLLQYLLYVVVRWL